jgi:hypothetical protein
MSVEGLDSDHMRQFPRLSGAQKFLGSSCHKNITTALACIGEVEARFVRSLWIVPHGG